MFDVTWAFPGPKTPALFTPGRAVTCEILFTLVLVHSALHTGTKQGNHRNSAGKDLSSLGTNTIYATVQTTTNFSVWPSAFRL